MGEIILNLIINGFVALIMITIGICMAKKKTPTGFYTGETPHKSEEIKDVKKWNLIHGLMFIIYGVMIILLAVLMIFTKDTIFTLCIYFGVYLIPIIAMVVVHTYLENNFVIKK